MFMVTEKVSSQRADLRSEMAAFTHITCHKLVITDTAAKGQGPANDDLIRDNLDPLRVHHELSIKHEESLMFFHIKQIHWSSCGSNG
jgi:hypothetical protein